MTVKHRRINEEIRAREVRVISDNGEPLGVMGLEEAITKAADADMDLVEIGFQEWLVLAKIMDYGKFMFKQQKSQSQSRSNAKKTELKTLKISYKISDHDLDVRRNQALRFAKEKHQIKVVLTLRWRENHYEKLAMEKIVHFAKLLEEHYKAEGNPVRSGNIISLLLNPK